MKIIVNILFFIYKIFFSPLIHAVIGSSTVCRFEESCSTYARRMILTYGILYGSRRAIVRFLSCQPFYK
ncbi:MAG: membrane protein insertion efficiency factor YidD [Candidatus Levybacteria bacterium]|nr:membrane protein insertion efficiency factor YidD [Candidatus Levybacteria bacterium]